MRKAIRANCATGMVAMRSLDHLVPVRCVRGVQVLVSNERKTIMSELQLKGAK